MDTWSKLSQYDKAEIMRLALQEGIYNLAEIRKVYNEFAEGGKKDGEMTRVRRADGSYAYVKTKDGHAITGGTGKYNLYDANGKVIGTGVGDGFPYVGDIRDEGYLDEITVTPQGMQTQDNTYDADALLKAAQQAERNKEIARNRAVDAKVSQYAFTPEGFFGQALQPMNLLSPTHTGRGIYNLASGNGYGDMRDLFLPNSGVFSEEFAAEHPYLTMAGNTLTDALTLGTGAALRNMPKYRVAMQAENRAAQEAVANQWDNMISRGVRRNVNSEYKTVPTKSAAINLEDANEYVQLPYGLRTNTPLVTRDTPEITAENAANMTPKQWTAAQDAAIARGDMAEAARLHRLHEELNGYHTGFYHETKQPFVSFNKPGRHSYNDVLSPFGVFTKSTDKSIGLGGYQMPLSVQYKNALHVADKKELLNMLPQDLQKKIMTLLKYKNNNTNQQLWNSRAYQVKQEIGKFLSSNGYDALKIDKDWAGSGLIENERWTDATIVPSPGQVKSSAVVTYDPVTGERIPLGDRHNKNINNTLYGGLPWLLGGTAAALYGNSQE